MGENKLISFPFYLCKGKMYGKEYDSTQMEIMVSVPGDHVRNSFFLTSSTDGGCVKEQLVSKNK